MEERRVKQTLLSTKPRENSLLVALAVTLVLFLVAALCWRVNSNWSALLAASTKGVFERGEYWQLLTGELVHANFGHLLSNALLFTFFGYLLYAYFGFFVFPFLCFLLGGLVNYLSLLTYQPADVRLVGASGMVYLMVGFWLTMYMLIERRLSVRRRIIHAVGVGLIVLMPTVLHQEVSYRTHAIGVVVGMLSALVYYRFARRRIQSVEVSEPLDDMASDTVSEEPWLEVDDI
ncbi:MAG: rhomboid family intramembrane serine protease [Acidobacteriota bacterium]|jgi:rhomboid protease GluP